jgi:hypothetical protein
VVVCFNEKSSRVLVTKIHPGLRSTTSLTISSKRSECPHLKIAWDTHRAETPYEGLPVSAIIVTHQIGRCRVPRERFHDLSRQPFSRAQTTASFLCRQSACLRGIPPS